MGEIAYIWKPARAYSKGRVQPLRGVILHSSDGHREGDVATLTGPAVSSHWYVTKDGTYYHFVDDSDTAYHAGKVLSADLGNSATIGIEQEHIDGEENWPDVLVKATANLVAALEWKHGSLWVKSHAEVAAPKGRKVDPLGYPWSLFHQHLEDVAHEDWTFKPVNPK